MHVPRRTRISVKKIHGFPNKCILDVSSKTGVTWRDFFRRYGVAWNELETDDLVVKSVGKKAQQSLNAPIVDLLGKYKTNKMTVSVVQIQDQLRVSNEARTRPATRGFGIASGIFNSQGEEFADGTRAIPNPRDCACDDLSQLSHGPDPNNLDSTDDIALKEAYISRIRLNRPAIFRQMLEEYKALKASGGNRDAKWFHYAPLLNSVARNGFADS